MKKTIAFIAAVAVVSGIQFDGLRVKIGWSDALADIEYFFKIPRTIREAENEGWQRTERPPGPLPELRLYCHNGRGVCPLFDPAGFIAGLQIAFPLEEFESLAVRPEKKMVRWRAPAMIGEPAREYWTATQFFVSEESLKAGAGPQVENGATLQDGGIWVKGPDNRLMRIPSTEMELNSTAFKKQNCIPNMGIHYYYNMTQDLKCEDFFPWFALITDGELVGSGFQVFGRLLRNLKYRDWFERPRSLSHSAKITIPHAPECLVEWAAAYGVVSLHIYYVDKPWTIKCRDGDSIEPATVYERFLLSGYRYANQIGDELRSLIIG